jgi:transcriptional regulator with XRE-family HTH domain
MPHGQNTACTDGRRLRTLRQDACMSFRDLAKACEKAGQRADPTQLSRYERGLAQPRPKLVEALAKVFKVEPRELYLKEEQAAA